MDEYLLKGYKRLARQIIQTAIDDVTDARGFKKYQASASRFFSTSWFESLALLADIKVMMNRS
jgi:hypothetical protein